MKNLYKIILVSLVFIPGVLFGQNLTISGGNNYSLVVCGNGNVQAWGDNSAGQLGLTSDNDAIIGNGNGNARVGGSNIPVTLGGLPEIFQVDAGSGSHALALTCDNQIISWGTNTFGQLGNPSVTLGGASADPVFVVDAMGNPLTGIQFVSGGNTASYAIANDGRLYAWGSNGDSQRFTCVNFCGNETGVLGINSNDPNFTTDVPTFVVDVLGNQINDIVLVEAGDANGYALTGAGKVYSWGDTQDKANGRTGNTNAADFVLADTDDDGTVDGDLTGIVGISAGDRHVLAIDDEGYVWSWGGDWGRGQLGRGDGFVTVDYSARVQGPGGIGLLGGPSDPVVGVSAGQAYSIAVTESGKVYTWGGNIVPSTPADDREYSVLGVGECGTPASWGNASQEGTGALNQYPQIATYQNGDLIDGTGTQPKIIGVSDGDYWAYIINEDNDIFVAGSGANGELGIAGSTQECRFRELSLPNCVVNVPCPDPQLTDVEVCPNEDYTITAGSLFPGFRATWTRPDATTFIQNNPYGIDGSGPPVDLQLVVTNIDASKIGTYRLVIEDLRGPNQRPCNDCPGVDVTMDISFIDPGFSDPSGLTYCGNNATVNVNTTATADIYHWYPSISGGTINDTLGQTVGSNSTDIDLTGVTGTGTKTVYVEAAGIGGEFLRRANDLCSSNLSERYFLSDNASNPDFQQGFEVLKPVTLNSLSFSLRSRIFNDGLTRTTNVNFSIYGSKTNANGDIVADEGNVIRGFTYPFSRTRNGGDEEFHDVVFPVDVNLLAGTYFLSVDRNANTGRNGNFNLEILKPGCNQPMVVDNVDGSTIQYIGGSQDFNNPKNDAGPFYDLDFTAAPTYTCGRIPVELTELCPCAKPDAVDAGMNVSVCPGDDVTLTGSFTPSTDPVENAMRYVWYQGANPVAGDYTTLTAAQVSSGMIPAFSVNNVGDANDGVWRLRVQDAETPADINNSICYTESTVSISQKPLPTATLETGGIFCPENLGTTGSETLTITPSGAMAPYSVTYTGGGGGTENVTGATGNITDLAVGTYQLTSITSDGCTVDLTSVANTSATIAEHPALVVTPSTDCNNSTQTSTVSATITGGVPAGYTFSAVSPGTDGAINTVAGVETFTQTFSANGNTNYAYTISDGTNCDANEVVTTGTTNCACDVTGVLSTTDNTTICPSETVTLNVVASGGTGSAYTVTLNGPNGDVATTLNGGVYTVDVNVAGTYTIKSVNNATCNSGGSGSVEVMLNEDVDITTDLSTTPIYLCPNASLSLDVVATGTGLASNGGNLQYAWTRTPGGALVETSNTYSKNVVDNATDGGNYQVTVTGACGSESSEITPVTVDEIVTGTLDVSQLTICQGVEIDLNVTGIAGTGPRTGATVDPLTFTWTAPNGETSTNGNLNIPVNTTDGDNTGDYSVSIAGECNTVNLGPKPITVNPTTVISGPSIADPDLCPTDPLSLTVNATGLNLSYEWRLGVAIVGTNSPTYSVASVDAGDAGSYTVVVTGSCGEETSSPVNISVGAITQITTQPQEQEDCPGGNVTFGVGATGTLKPTFSSLEYQWFKDNVLISGATDASYQVTPLASADSGDYFVRVEGACGILNSDVVPLNVSSTSTPTVTLTVVPETICRGSGAIFTANGTGTGGMPTYEFRDQSNGAILQPAGSSNTYSPSAINATQTVEVIMTSNSACLASGASNPVSDDATVTVIEPATATISTPVPVVPNEHLTADDFFNNITADDLGAGYGAVWTKVDLAEQGTISSSGAFVTNLTDLDLIEPEAGDPNVGQGTTTLRVTVRDNGSICPAAMDEITIIRKDVSVPTIGPGAVCAADITVATPYLIQGSGFNAAIETPNIIDVDNASGNGAGFTFANTNSTNLTTPPAITGNSQDFTFTYRIDNSVSGDSPSGDGVYTIYAVPTVADAGPDQNICTDQTTLAAVVPPTGFVGTGTWSCDGGTVTDVNSPTSTLTGIANNQVINCTWSTSNVLCLGTSNDVRITNIGSATAATINFGGVDVTGQPLDICVGDVDALVGSSPQGGDVGSWTVTNTTGTNYGAVSGANANQGNVTASQAGLVRLTWTINPSVAGCPNSVAFTDLTIYDTPDADIIDFTDALGNSITEICDGLGINVETAGVNTGDIVAWTGSIMPTGGTTNWTVTDAQLALGINTLTYTVDNPGCPLNADSKNITVNPIDNISVSLNTVGTKCEGDDETFIATPAPTMLGTPTFEWDYSEDGVGPVSTSSNVFSLTDLDVASGSVSVRMTTDSKCPNPGFATDATPLTVVPGPAPEITTFGRVICEDTTVAINAVDNGADPSATSYEWFLNGNVLPNSSGPTPDIESLTSINSGGTYSYVLRASVAACGFVDSDPMVLDIRSIPNVNASAGTTNPIVTKTVLGATLSGTHSGESSEWIISPIASENILIATALNPENPITALDLDPENGGTFTATLISTDGPCMASDQVVVVVSAPISAPNVFTPNGDGENDLFFIRNIETFPGATVRIFNRWGTKIYESDNYASEQWDGGDVPDGVYYYVVQFGPDQEKGEGHSGVIHVLR